MSSCCASGACSTTAEMPLQACPACGATGAAVDRITLKALLTSDALRRGVPPDPRFCANASCDVVYFDNHAGLLFHVPELLVAVHAKEPGNDDVPVCYCFGHTPKSIRQEIVAMGASTATQVITAEVKAGRCACEVRNPKGSCCLGDVAQTERRAAALFSLS